MRRSAAAGGLSDTLLKKVVTATICSGRGGSQATRGCPSVWLPEAAQQSGYTKAAQQSGYLRLPTSLATRGYPPVWLPETAHQSGYRRLPTGLATRGCPSAAAVVSDVGLVGGSPDVWVVKGWDVG